MRTLSLLHLLLVFVSPATQVDVRSEPAQVPWSVADAPGVECCKICRKGKACGDTCIARDKDCHEPPGCACDE